MCRVTGGVSQWSINGDIYTPNDLLSGVLTGHNITGNNNIVVEDIVMNDPRNGSIYICFIPQGVGMPDIESDPTTLYVSGECTGYNLICFCHDFEIWKVHELKLANVFFQPW